MGYKRRNSRRLGQPRDISRGRAFALIGIRHADSRRGPQFALRKRVADLDEVLARTNPILLGHRRLPSFEQQSVGVGGGRRDVWFAGTTAGGDDEQAARAKRGQRIADDVRRPDQTGCDSGVSDVASH